MKILIAFSLFCLAAFPALAGEGNWLTDYDTALAQAKKENKPLLIDFTGSDWCPPCKMMAKEVFASSTFQTFAAKDLVLLKADFPKLKPLAPEQQKANEELAQKFNIEGFPTLIVLNGEGKELARNVGYKPGGPSAVVEWIQKAAK